MVEIKKQSVVYNTTTVVLLKQKWPLLLKHMSSSTDSAVDLSFSWKYDACLNPIIVSLVFQLAAILGGLFAEFVLLVCSFFCWGHLLGQLP